MNYFLRDKKLTKVLKERNKIMDESKDWLKKKDEIDKRLTKIGYRMNKLKEDTSKILKENKRSIANGRPLGDFEYISQVTLQKGVPVVSVSNLIDENWKTKEQIKDYIIKQAINKEGMFKDGQMIEEINGLKKFVDDGKAKN